MKSETKKLLRGKKKTLPSHKMKGLPGVLMVGTGEYTTGITSSGLQSKSDKRIGVVGLVFFELRRQQCIGRLVMVNNL